MNDNEKIMDKLEKLLRLAESPNTNEAYAAAQKAQELFIKYNIDSGLLEHHQASKRRVIERSTGIDFTAMTNPWIINLANVIAKNHRCKAFRYQVPHARRMTVGLLGFEEDFEFCSGVAFSVPTTKRRTPGMGIDSGNSRRGRGSSSGDE